MDDRYEKVRVLEEEARQIRGRMERDDHLKASTIARGERDQCATEASSAQVGTGAGFAVGAQGLTLENVEDAFTYHAWDGWQQEAGNIVRETLTAAARAILRVVPAGPSRTRALNNLMDARMLCNQSITFRGRF